MFVQIEVPDGKVINFIEGKLRYFQRKIQLGVFHLRGRGKSERGNKNNNHLLLSMAINPKNLMKDVNAHHLFIFKAAGGKYFTSA